MEVLPLPVAVDFTEDVWSFSLEDPEEQIAREILADRIGAELREAKARYGHQNANNAPTTSRGSPPEVLLPAGLLHSIAGDILHASRDEPCGVRGCVIYIDYEESSKRKSRIGTVKCDPYTVNTFELYLTFRPHSSSWTSKLPLFLQNLASRSTVVISSDYSLSKRKLFRSSH